MVPSQILDISRAMISNFGSKFQHLNVHIMFSIIISTKNQTTTFSGKDCARAIFQVQRDLADRVREEIKQSKKQLVLIKFNDNLVTNRYGLIDPPQFKNKFK